MTNDTHTPQESRQPVSENDKKAFIDFYNTHSIIPVSQDISDSEFIFKRNALYTLLGFPLGTLRERNILEFGPGGGYNATAITHCKPCSYVFVDASEESLKELERKNKLGIFGKTSTEIVRSNIFDFKDDRLFDLVIIEGVIPGQTKPKEMLSHAASFVSPSGFLSITTASSVSLVSELCRRIFRPFILNNHHSFYDQVEFAERIFDSQLKTLGTKTRPTRDWVLDVILHPWPANYSFSLIEAVNTLEKEFCFYNSSPKFLIDDRFYKKITSGAINSNDLVREQYSMRSVGMLDYRVSFLESDYHRGQSSEIEQLCDVIEQLHDEIIQANNYAKLEKFFSKLNQLANLLTPEFHETIQSIRNFITDFGQMIESNSPQPFSEFGKWWGRGQQYVSFVRVPR